MVYCYDGDLMTEDVRPVDRMEMFKEIQSWKVFVFSHRLCGRNSRQRSASD